MAEKRTDSRGRRLKNGEYQKADGRYEFRYLDAKGNLRSVYAWTLTKDDKTPSRKRDGPNLRQLEKQIEHDLVFGVSPEKMTVLELAERYTATRQTVRKTTKRGYGTVLNFLRKDDFGARLIADVTTLEAREWLVHLQRDCGKRFSSVHGIRGVLRPAFRLAEEDMLVKRNPFDFELMDVLINDSVRRESVSVRDERRLLEFMRLDSHYSQYYDAFLILFRTGLRVSELCGLTLDDIDFERGSIRVDKQLQRASDGLRYIERPKTSRGERYVPMGKEVADAFKRVIACRETPTVEPVVDGVSGFLFLDISGMPCVAMHWEHRMGRAVAKYNRIYREPLPKITPHMCRHSFATRMARNGMSPARLKYIMGHADIATTYNIYTHLGFEDVREEVLRIEREGL